MIGQITRDELVNLLSGLLEMAKINLQRDKDLLTIGIIVTASGRFFPVPLKFTNDDEKAKAKALFQYTIETTPDKVAVVFITDSWVSVMQEKEAQEYYKHPTGIKGRPDAMEAISISGVTKDFQVGTSVLYRRDGDQIIFDQQEPKFNNTFTPWLDGAFAKGGNA